MKYLICLFCTLFFLLSCKKDHPAPTPVVTPTPTPSPIPNPNSILLYIETPTTVSYTSLTVDGSLLNNQYIPIIETGFCWNANKQIPVYSDGNVAVPAANGKFSATLSLLKPATLYRIRSYVKTATGTVVYSAETKDVLTLSYSVPLFPIDPKTPISPVKVLKSETVNGVSSVTVSVEIISDGGYPITERGFRWVQLPTSGPSGTNDPKIISGTGTGIYTATITGLLPNTSYSIYAYAINQLGTGIGFGTHVTTPQ
jgi:hypothetical protein